MVHAVDAAAFFVVDGTEQKHHLGEQQKRSIAPRL
jgi:hypothetical protein